ncbi:hypothetical protein [Streptomyces sp. NPDC001410]|uniref:hypothetical protein n=1 Tax=Streptomyces sp. NPDC001410 TaxID=3364574 RepID=UPI0036AAE2BA
MASRLAAAVTDPDGNGELATEADSPSGRNVTDTWTTQLVLGHTQDMSVIDGEAEGLAID